ncbi:MAG: sugar phosphate isomerase/epimerase family protein [Chthoniobacteraceae bacterium]
MLSISTCWNSSRHTDGKAMLEELLAFGFDAVELGHGIRISLWEGIQEVYDSGRVRFSSLHNFCPLPVEITRPSPDCLLFTTYREVERQRAVRQTLKTIDFAVRIGAPYVVLHCGRVVMKPITQPLIELAKAGRHLAPEYARLKTQAVIRREKAAPKHIERLKGCLKEIAEYAGEKGIRLGLESRQAYEEIPSEREFPDLLETFPAPTVNYWHDFGHVQIRHNLGFVDHAEWLAKMAPRLLACHLHDVEWPGRDHRAPFTGGSVDYDRLIPLLPKGTLFVWEMNPKRTREEIAVSLARWKERFVS